MHITGKVLFLLLAVVGAYSELEDVLSDRKIESPEASRSFKNYNHPPLFVLDTVDSNSEDIEVRKVRDATENDDKPEKNTLPEKSRISSVRKATFVESSNPEKIPVTVIYDPEPITHRGNKELNTTNIRRRKQPKSIRPSGNTNNLAVTPEEKKVIPETTVIVVTEKNPTTSPSPRTIVPKLFTKRPPEFNPVFKTHRQRDPVVKILENTNLVYSHTGNFHYSFEGGDGTKVSSQGELKTFDNDATGEAVVGNVFYKDNDGNDVSLSYTADENGYRAYGDHLPTPPPIPPAIARALKYLATATTPEPVTKPSRSSEPITSSNPVTKPTTSLEN